MIIERRAGRHQVAADVSPN